MTTAPTLARDIPLDQIEPVFKRARDKEGWERLKASMKAKGLQQPIQVEDMGRRNDKGIRYKLICGQGRTEAARALDWEKIPAIVKTAVGAEEFVGTFFDENINRVSLPWVAKARIIRDEMRGLGKDKDPIVRLAEVCADLGIDPRLGRRYLNALNNAAQEIEDDIAGLGVNIVERLTKLPAKGQLIVMEVARETKQDVVAVVEKAEKLARKTGEGWTAAALRKAIGGVKETLERQAKQLRTLRLHYALGPQNLLRLIKDAKFHAALKAAKINLSVLDALE
jgi:ParB-like chromosome segregation protein Spo0J